MKLDKSLCLSEWIPLDQNLFSFRSFQVLTCVVCVCAADSSIIFHHTHSFTQTSCRTFTADSKMFL